MSPIKTLIVTFMMKLNVTLRHINRDFYESSLLGIDAKGVHFLSKKYPKQDGSRVHLLAKEGSYGSP